MRLLKKLEYAVRKRNELEPIVDLVKPRPASGIAYDLRACSLGSVFAMKVFSGGVLLSHCGCMLLLSVIRHGRRISEGSPRTAETPHAGYVVSVERVAFHLVLNFCVSAVLIVLATWALRPTSGGGN